MNNGFNNFNGGYPTGGGFYGGMVYQPGQKIHMTQGLTAEQLKTLRKSGGFSLDITQEELFRSYCTHRNENSFATVSDDEGNLTCKLCGTKFKPFEGSPKEARELIDRTIDLIETTKMRSLSLPQKTIQDVFQIEPILKRIPDLYSQSINDYNRAIASNDSYLYAQENNSFSYYQNMLNPMAGNGYYDPSMVQPMPMYGAQPPMTYQQPYQGGQPQYGMGMNQYYDQQQYQQPYQGQFNNGVDMNMQPQQNAFNLNSAPVTASAPQPNNNAEKEVTVTKTLTD